VYAICKTYLTLRETLRDYVRGLMDDAHVYGDPIIRPLFYEFPDEPASWSVTDQYLFGSKYLVSPIMKLGQRSKNVMLPRGASWRRVSAEGHVFGDAIEGGTTVTVETPLGYMPVFQKMM
jgi:alpha-D-xyloside xylohydrolase